MGGMAFLIYLEWRLAIGVLVILPALVFFIRYFSKKIHILSHQSMEQHARVSSQFQESLSSVSLIKSFSSEMRTVGHLISESRKAFQISLEQSTVGSVAHLIISSTPGIARVFVSQSPLIARALVKDPDILVLDEPASALDSLTEKSIFESLPDFLQNKTLFVVAHRISTIKNSDHILLLNENRLVAIGKHESLLETNDYYRSLVSYQQFGKD